MDIFATTTRDRLYDVGLLLFRITVSCFMLTHGLPKLGMLFADGPVEFVDPLGVGQTTSLVLTIIAEVVCSFLIIIGLLTRVATIPLIIVMSIAFFYIHMADDFGTKEKAGLYLISFILLLITGPGRYSFDNLISKRRNTKTNYYTTTNM